MKFDFYWNPRNDHMKYFEFFFSTFKLSFKMLVAGYWWSTVDGPWCQFGSWWSAMVVNSWQSTGDHQLLIDSPILLVYCWQFSNNNILTILDCQQLDYAWRKNWALWIKMLSNFLKFWMLKTLQIRFWLMKCYYNEKNKHENEDKGSVMVDFMILNWNIQKISQKKPRLSLNF